VSSFAEEEELRVAIARHGHGHDCTEAGCDLTPDGKKIPDEAKPKRRRRLSKKYRDLWEKYRGYPYPG